jgi:hypothetical protein
MTTDIVLLVIGVALLDSAHIWVQKQAVPRVDGNLVPPWWVAVLGITYGPATIALIIDGWPRTVAVWIFLLTGLAAWPVARLVDGKRSILAAFAEDGRDIEMRRHIRNPPNTTIQALQECEDASVDEVARLTAEFPSARHAVARWDAKRQVDHGPNGMERNGMDKTA